MIDHTFVPDADGGFQVDSCVDCGRSRREHEQPQELRSSNQQVDPYKCFHPLCTVSPKTGGAVFRINAKGQPGIFACREHMKQTDASPIHPDVDRVVSAIEGRKP